MSKFWKYVFFAFCGFLVMKPFFAPDFLFNMGFSTIKTEQLIGVMLTLMWVAGEGAWYMMKNASPQIHSYNITSSTSGSHKDIIKYDDYAFLRLGGINAYGLVQKGSEGTLITPWPAYRYTESGIFVNAKAKKNIKPSSLPPKLRKFIESEGLPYPIHFAISPAVVEEDNKAFVEWKKNFEDINEMENIKEMMRDEIMTDTQEVVEWRGSIGGTKKSTISKLQRKIEKMNKNEG